MAVQGSFDALRSFYNLAKKTQQNGGSVNIYDEIPAFHYRKDFIYTNWEEFKKWFDAAFTGHPCIEQEWCLCRSFRKHAPYYFDNHIGEDEPFNVLTQVYFVAA